MEETKENTKKVATKKATTKKATAEKSTATKNNVNKKVENATEVKKEVNSNTSQSEVYEIDAFAAISLILGVASMITWLYPILGIAVAIPGLSMGIVTHETKRSYYSLLGIVMSLVGIILSIVKSLSI